MPSMEERLTRVENAILALADMRDPAQEQFRIVGSGERSRRQNEAAETLSRLVKDIRESREG